MNNMRYTLSQNDVFKDKRNRLIKVRYLAHYNPLLSACFRSGRVMCCILSRGLLCSKMSADCCRSLKAQQ